MSEMSHNPLLATLHSAKAQTQQQIQDQQANEQSALDEQKQHFQQRLQNVEHVINDAMVKLVAIVSLWQGQSTALHNSQLQQNQEAFNQTVKVLEKATQTLQTSLTEVQTIQKAISDQHQANQTAVTKAGEELRKDITSDMQTTKTLSQDKHLITRKNMSEEHLATQQHNEAAHQATRETITQAHQQTNTMIQKMLKKYFKIGIVFGSIFGVLIALFIGLSMLNRHQYQKLVSLGTQIDYHEKQLTELNDQINRTPIQFQAQALIDIRPMPSGGINIVPKSLTKASCQNNPFGSQTLYISPNPYYHPN